MDISPIYELRNRLRASMIAGTNLLSEDFRLKKAVEGFAPLACVSPVFGKIGELAAKLSKDNSPETLLDTITLTDAVITTLGTTEVTGELEDIPIEGSNAVIVNSTYSQLSPIINALTTTGSGNYNTVVSARDHNPEIFKDYRIKNALVKGLGASYSELADTVADILAKMGKEIIPLIKKDFDPKGKREALRRVNIIEKVCGAEENAFYLEQLEKTDKGTGSDVRKALIYALRHEESNTEKLIELTKTEKGKMKTAALTALVSLDNERAAEFFEEYSKKKPDETVDILSNAHSEWASELTARLIDDILTNADGEKVNLPDVLNSNTINSKFKLKTKLDRRYIARALWGKTGENIEKIYREAGNNDIVNSLSVNLGESIAVTDNESLKKLAFELNSAPATQGCYVYAEAITRLLNRDDGAEWFAKQIHTAYDNLANDSRAVANSPIDFVLNKIFFDGGKYYISNAKFDHVSDGYSYNAPRPIKQSVKGAISDALMECSCLYFDMVLENWINQGENDKEFCKEVGEYFCKKIRYDSAGYSTPSVWGWCAGKCGFWNVKDLFADCFKNAYTHGKTSTVSMITILQSIPGDNAYKLEQARAVVKLAREKKPPFEFNIDTFESWAYRCYDHSIQ